MTGNWKNDTLFSKDDILFEWDEDKSARCMHDRGISFDQACMVFLDQNRKESLDDRHYGEERYAVLGIVGKYRDLLYVVYTVRGTRIRIISARPATKMEEDVYYDRDQGSQKRRESHRRRKH